MLYPIAIQQQDNLFHAHIPDIPVLEINDNLSIADTISNSRSKVIEHFTALFEKDMAIPPASDINTYLTDKKFAGWTWAIISIDMNRVMGEEVNIHIKLTQRVNKHIRHLIEDSDQSMNDFVVSAIREKLEKIHLENEQKK